MTALLMNLELSEIQIQDSDLDNNVQVRVFNLICLVQKSVDWGGVVICIGLHAIKKLDFCQSFFTC